MSAGRLPLYGESSFDDVLSCVHCGLCLDACPTYRELGTEQDSPRGRVYLMRGMWEGELSPTDDVVAPLSRCLDCRACETACPSGVPYGQLLETTRAALLQARPGGLRQRLARAFFLRTVLPSDGWRRWLSRAGRLYAALGIDRVVAGWPLRHLLPAQLVGAQAMLPAFSGRSFKATYEARTHVETPRARVGLFTGCIMDVAERQVHASTVRLLEAAGCEVVVPREQTCCGALHVHSGDRATAETLARINTRVFGAAQLDAVIVNAAGCGAQLQQYAHLVQEDAAGFARLGAQVVDVMEYLAGVPGLVASLEWSQHADTVLYDAPCHLQHAQGVDEGPRRLLAELPGVTLSPLTEADRCCGSAGIYNLLQPELAGAVLARKVASIRETLAAHPGATTLVTGNPGCLFQMRAGVRAAGLPLRVVHPVEYLAQRLDAAAVAAGS